MEAIRKGQYGFTLVEAIVVAAIVAILAAVAIPLYSGFVQSQREETTKNIAKAAATAANIYYRRTNDLPECNPPDCVDMLKLFLPDAEKYAISIVGRKVWVTDLSDPHDPKTKASADY
jgi:prepilin-type N-terminal cleavage/methylation domain-containing protein